MTVQRLTRRTNLRKNSLDLDKIFSNPTYDAEGKVVLPTGGATDISSLSDVTATTFQNGELLKFNGSAWINTTIEVADLSDSNTIALLDSPVLTGTPEAPTPSTLDSSDKLATTQFVQDAIASSGTNALTYQGSVSVSNFATTLQNAVKGSFYKISTGGTASDGRVYASGDSVIVNADMSGTFADSKLDKIDNVDPETSDEIIGSHPAQNYTAQNTDSLTTHLDGIDSALASKLDATLVNPAVGEFLIYSGSVWVNSVAASTHLSDSSDLARLASPAFTGTPTAPTATAGTNTTQVATTEFVTTAVSGAATGITELVQDTTPQLGGSLDVNGNSITSNANGNVVIDPNGTGTVTLGSDLVPDLTDSHTIGSETSRFVTAHTDINGAIRFKAKNDQGGQITKGQAVYIKGVSGTIPTVGLAQANSASTMPAFGLALETANDQAEIQIVTFGNLSNYDTTTYNLAANQTIYVSDTVAGGLTNTPPSGESNLIQNIGRVVRANGSSGIVKVGGAGRSNATPNLDDGKIFLGDSNNQAVSTALSSINLSSFNDDLNTSYQPLDAGLTSISGLTTSADKLIYTTGPDTYAIADLTPAGRALLDDADASAQRTTLGLGTAATSASTDFLASTATIDDLSDVAVTSITDGQVLIYNSTSGDWENSDLPTSQSNPNIYVTTSTTYAPSASDVPNLIVWYGASNTTTFLLDLPDILNVLSGTGATGSVVESFTMWVGRGQAGDIKLTQTQAANGIEVLGGSGISYTSPVTISPNGQWVKIVGWKTSSSNARYLVQDPSAAIPVNSVNSLTGTIVLDSDDLLANRTGTNYTAATSDTITTHLGAIDTALGLKAGTTQATETTAGIIEIATNAEAGAGTATDKALVPSNVSSLSLASSQVSGLATVATSGAYSDLSGTPTLGTAASFDVGTTASDVVQLDASARLPAVDGSQLTNLPSGGISNLIEDTSPQLGGDLDINNKKIIGNLIPTSTNRTLGSTTANGQWGGLYLKENSKIYWGTDQDVELIHSPDKGLILDLSVTDGTGEPEFHLKSQNGGNNGPNLALNTESASPAVDDIVGNIIFKGEDSSLGLEQEYGRISGIITDPTSGSETGRISIMPYGAYANGRQGLHVHTALANKADVVVNHDAGTYGLRLGVGTTTATLVTTSANELNLLDGDTTVGSSVTITDTDGIILNDGGVTKLVPALDLKTYAASSGGISNVVEDTTPQLGGDLDLNGNDIITTSNANLDLAPDGTGVVNILGNTTGGNNQGAIRLNCEQNSHHVTIKSPTHTALSTGGSYSLTLPANDGNTNDVLQTDGSGVLSWVAQSGGGGGTSYTYSAISATTTAQAWYHYSVDTSGGAVTLNLPALSSVTDGDEIRVKLRVAGNDLTIDANSTETIDGQQTQTLSVATSAITLVAGSTEWEIV